MKEGRFFRPSRSRMEPRVSSTAAPRPGTRPARPLRVARGRPLSSPARACVLRTPGLGVPSVDEEAAAFHARRRTVRRGPGRGGAGPERRALERALAPTPSPRLRVDGRAGQRVLEEAVPSAAPPVTAPALPAPTPPGGRPGTGAEGGAGRQGRRLWSPATDGPLGAPGGPDQGRFRVRRLHLLRGPSSP